MRADFTFRTTRTSLGFVATDSSEDTYPHMRLIKSWRDATQPRTEDTTVLSGPMLKSGSVVFTGPACMKMREHLSCGAPAARNTGTSILETRCHSLAIFK